MRTAIAAAWLLAVALAACGGPSAPPPAAPPAAANADARLADDVGGWTPPSPLVDFAAAMGDPARRTEALARLDALSPWDRADALRAGLRLRDRAAAAACAARLEWEQIDRWECAQCVDLLKARVLSENGEGEFDDLRSYLGSAELRGFIESLPPQPWDYPTKSVGGQLHRVLHEDALDAWTLLARHADPDVAEGAVSEWWATVAPRCDRRREDVLRLAAPGRVFAPDPHVGFPSALVEHLREAVLADKPPPAEDEDDDENRPPKPSLDDWTRRWIVASTPGLQDEELLLAIARKEGTSSVWDVGGLATVHLGRIRGDASREFLRAEAAADPESVAWAALGLRGEADAIERLVAWSADDTHEEPLAALMEAAPERARAVLSDRLLGADDEAAFHTLDQLGEFLPPGVESPAHAFRFRRTLWDGFEPEARAAAISAARRAYLGAIVPACRTRALAEAACARLDGSFFHVEGAENWDYEAEAYLETAAPDAYRKALRRIAHELDAEDEEDREAAFDRLHQIGDRESAAEFVDAYVADENRAENLFTDGWRGLARSASPAVVAYLRGRVAEDPDAAGPLAVALGAPEDLADAFDELPGNARAELIAGRWREALHAILETAPNVEHGHVGLVGDDPVVRRYLDRLRGRRDLELYWYATGELAIAGDASARAELWRTYEEGRYRIVYAADELVKTLGRDLAATMPFWREELRGSCCKTVTGQDAWDDWFGVETYHGQWRTPYDRAGELWEAAGGAKGFVWSRVLDRYVLAPR